MNKINNKYTKKLYEYSLYIFRISEILIGLVLIYYFNPFKKNITINFFLKQIIFAAGLSVIYSNYFFTKNVYNNILKVVNISIDQDL